VGLDVRGAKCLVVGGGRIGSRKVTNLVAAGADVTVVSPAVTDTLAVQLEADRLCWIQDEYREEHLEGAFLVVAATDDETLNANIVEGANCRGILVCDASSADRSKIIFGALHKAEHDVTIAVFTDGRDPAGARRTRDRVAGLLDSDRSPEGRSGPS
jgi:siroheme synthase-like protein